ncbi:MAG: AAA family ATPase, partial [Chloroflexota bacterium]
MERIAETAERIVSNVERVIIGKRSEVELALIGLICQGHLLIEDVPGVGKTVLAKAFAKSIGCTFRRIQFTPDLLPSDVTGVSVYNQKTGEFTFRPGPIMAQIVLADEINRATPKTQSALLECMEERQITVDGVTYVMPMPFLVMATQNPIEYEGTFPLPEAQLDRFMMRMRLGYPRRAEELEIIARQKVAHPIDSLEQVVGVDELVSMQQEIRRDVEVSPLVREYIVALTSATRQHPEVYLGASPRGSLGLFRACQAR